MDKDTEEPVDTSSDQHDTASDTDNASDDSTGELPKEYGGANGPEPTRYGDWERNGRCTDF